MRIIGIDPGSAQSGMSMIDGKSVLYASNLPNEALLEMIKVLSADGKIVAVIEDIVPYTLRLTPQIIDTCKFIGQICWRLTGADFIESVHMAARSSVRKWIFDTCQDIVLPRVKKRMEAINKRKLLKGERGLIKNDGCMREASFNYTDDRMIIAALKHLYDIPTPKPGKPNIHGLHDHSWQALATAAYYQSKI